MRGAAIIFLRQIDKQIRKINVTQQPPDRWHDDIFTNDVMILPNAAPMITPTARSTTGPFIANSLNSFNMERLPLCFFPRLDQMHPLTLCTITTGQIYSRESQ